MPPSLPRKLPANPGKALFEACRDGDEERARALVELGASFEQGSSVVAVSRGSLALLDLALEHGLPLGGPAAAKVLEAAIRHGRPAHLARMLERGVDLSALAWPLHLVGSGPPGVDVEAGARREVIDVLLRHGASIDAPAPTGTTPLGAAIAMGNGDVAAHLLASGADASSGMELHAAFVASMVGLARTMAARGAPMDAIGPSGFALSEVVEPDLVTPKELFVRYRMTAAPQRVRVALRLARFSDAEPHGWQQRLVAEARVPSRLGELGVLGNEAGPGARAALKEEHFALEGPQRGMFEVTIDLRVAGVSREALAFAVRALCGGSVSYPARIHIEGEAAPDGTEGSVTTEAARAWFADPGLDALTAPMELPFSVTDEPRGDVLAVVEHESGAGTRVADVALELNAFVPPAGGTRQDRGVRRALLGIVPGKKTARSTTLLAVLANGDGEPVGFDREGTRALMLRALAACGGIERVTWCLPQA